MLVCAFSWEQRKLGDITSKIGSGKTPLGGNDAYVNDGIYLIRSQNVHDDIVDLSDVVFIDEETDISMSNSRVITGDVLLNITGASIGRSAVYIGSKNANVNQHVCIIRPIGNYESKYIQLNISSSYGQKQIELSQAGGGREGLNFQQIGKITFMFPNIEEQRKIGEYFSQLNTLIALHQRECFSFDFGSRSAKVAQKTISWEQRKLSDMVERVTRKNENLESELPLTISAQYGLIDQNEFFDKRIASRDVSGYYLLKKGEFAYNKSTSSDAPWGAVKRLDRYEMGVLSTLYIVFALKEDGNIDSDFLVSYYDTDCWHKGVQAIAAEGARNHGLLNITPADYFETVLTVPSDVKEQHQIGTFFAKLDTLITLHQRKLETLQKMKKSLLQKMFV